MGNDPSNFPFYIDIVATLAPRGNCTSRLYQCMMEKMDPSEFTDDNDDADSVDSQHVPHFADEVARQ